MKATKHAHKLSTLKGKRVAITGKCWLDRKDLIEIIRQQGGEYSSRVTRNIDILVRGSSNHWKHGSYGVKESILVKLLQDGNTIIMLHDLQFKNLIEKKQAVNCLTTIAGQPIEWLSPSKKEFERIAKISGPLDREYTVNGRLEQGFLRDKLFAGKEACKCSLCGRIIPTELMIAAHIKPRSECNSKERRDASNIVFPVCLFGCDSLYERGLIGVNNNGEMVLSNQIKIVNAIRDHFKLLKGKKCGAWHKGNRTYFQWHFERRFWTE